MRTIKTSPMFWVQQYPKTNTLYPTVYDRVPSYYIYCELDVNLTCVVREFEDEDDARDLADRLNVAAYRWAISESND